MNTIYLSESKKAKMAYYITSINEDTKVALITAKQTKNKIDQKNLFDKLNTLIGIDCNSILKLGETSEITTSSLSDYVTYFLGKDTEGLGYVGRNREIHYRDYAVLEKEQKRLSWIVNRCQDITICVKTAVSKMNGAYTILWEIPIDDPKHLVLKEKFETNVVWKIQN